ncbi:hypothetical protein Hamer_G022067 [Homarus americanus]|uniref:Uncharacterized protein n=1 Tax=Homarus americanus TaxID=6706 RepID=A0A8J5TJ30_HOMAM|nr:hypothetical protein Hamer_G022067 [Homarus americanus]
MESANQSSSDSFCVYSERHVLPQSLAARLRSQKGSLRVSSTRGTSCLKEGASKDIMLVCGWWRAATCVLLTMSFTSPAGAFLGTGVAATVTLGSTALAALGLLGAISQEVDLKKKEMEVREKMKEVDMKEKKKKKEEDEEEEDVKLEAMMSEDPLGCAQLLVCELAARPSSLLQPEELAILSLFRDTVYVKPPLLLLPRPDSARSDGNQLGSAVRSGLRGVDCPFQYNICPFTPLEVLAVITAVINDH